MFIDVESDLPEIEAKFDLSKPFNSVIAEVVKDKKSHIVGYVSCQGDEYMTTVEYVPNARRGKFLSILTAIIGQNVKAKDVPDAFDVGKLVGKTLCINYKKNEKGFLVCNFYRHPSSPIKVDITKYDRPGWVTQKKDEMMGEDFKGNLEDMFSAPTVSEPVVTITQVQKTQIDEVKKQPPPTMFVEETKLSSPGQVNLDDILTGM